MKHMTESAIKVKYRTVLVIIIFILLSCVFYCDKLILGPYATIRIHDSFDTDFPRYAAQGELFLKNGFFGWYPNIICGIPAYAFHTPPYYILCLISLIFPLWFLYTSLVVLLMFIAAYGMYWFLKDFLGVSQEMSFLGGLLFSLHAQIFGNTLVHVVFNYAFPMFFMCLMTAGRTKVSFRIRLLSLMFVILVLLLSYLVLTIPMFFILQCFVIIFFTFDKKLSAKKMLFKTILVWGGYILLSAPLLYSLYKFIPFYQRGYSHYTAISAFLTSLPKNFIQLFLLWAKESYLLFLVIGLAPLIFYSRKVRRIFFVLATIILIIAFFESRLDIIRGTLFEKMDLEHFSWTTPFLIVLFVITGIEEFFRIKVAKALYVLSFLTAGLILIYPMRNSGIITTESLNITVSLFAFLFCLLTRPAIGNKRSILLVVIVLFIVLFGQFKIARILKFEPFPYKRFYESHSVFNNLKKEAEQAPFRVVTASSFPMVLQSYGLETTETRAALIPKRYKEFFREIIRPRLQTEKQSAFFDTYWYNLYLIDGEMTPYSNHEGSVEGLFNLPLLLMTNTKYIISLYRDPYLESISEKVIEAKSDNLIEAGLVNAIFKTADIYLNKPFFKRLIPDKLTRMQGDTLFKKVYYQTYFVYQLKDYFARGYLVPNAVVLDSDNEVLSKLSVQPVESLKSNVFFLKKDVTIAKIFYERRTLSKDDRVELVQYSPDKLIFKGIIASPRILIITNNYHPNWRAIVNGKEQKLYRANHTFQAVFLERAGNFYVTLLYEDPLLWKTHWLIFFGVILIIYAAFARIENNEEKRDAI